MDIFTIILISLISTISAIVPIQDDNLGYHPLDSWNVFHNIEKDRENNWRIFQSGWISSKPNENRYISYFHDKYPYTVHDASTWQFDSFQNSRPFSSINDAFNTNGMNADLYSNTEFYSMFYNPWNFKRINPRSNGMFSSANRNLLLAPHEAHQEYSELYPGKQFHIAMSPNMQQQRGSHIKNQLHNNHAFQYLGDIPSRHMYQEYDPVYLENNKHMQTEATPVFNINNWRPDLRENTREAIRDISENRFLSGLSSTTTSDQQMHSMRHNRKTSDDLLHQSFSIPFANRQIWQNNENFRETLSDVAEGSDEIGIQAALNPNNLLNRKKPSQKSIIISRQQWPNTDNARESFREMLEDSFERRKQGVSNTNNLFITYTIPKQATSFTMPIASRDNRERDENTFTAVSEMFKNMGRHAKSAPSAFIDIPYSELLKRYKQWLHEYYRSNEEKTKQKIFNLSSQRGTSENVAERVEDFLDNFVDATKQMVESRNLNLARTFVKQNSMIPRSSGGVKNANSIQSHNFLPPETSARTDNELYKQAILNSNEVRPLLIQHAMNTQPNQFMDSAIQSTIQQKHLRPIFQVNLGNSANNQNIAHVNPRLKQPFSKMGSAFDQQDILESVEEYFNENNLNVLNNVASIHSPVSIQTNRIQKVQVFR